MKKVLLALTALTFVFASCENNGTKEGEKKDSSGTAETKKDEAPAKKLTQQEEMAAWQAYATPGAPHQMLAAQTGNWEYSITYKVHPDSAREVTEKGTGVTKMMYGGKYQVNEYKGTMMGMPWEGHNMVAYDNAKKMFISTMMDNMGTGISYMQGPWDEATKSMTLRGKMVDPATGKENESREVVTMPDANNQTVEMWCTKDGKEQKMMSIKLVKKG